MERDPPTDGYHRRKQAGGYVSGAFWKNVPLSGFRRSGGSVSLHYGDCLDDVTYNDILVSACAENGIAAFTGDGVDSNVMVAATAAIKKRVASGFRL